MPATRSSRRSRLSSSSWPSAFHADALALVVAPAGAEKAVQILERESLFPGGARRPTTPIAAVTFEHLPPGVKSRMSKADVELILDLALQYQEKAGLVSDDLIEAVLGAEQVYLRKIGAL